jgi:uncharacterized protein YyaL (SSP411 family)
VPPAKDTKVLVSWNGLSIAALAVAGRALGEPRYLQAAARAARFILDRMRVEDGRLLHTYKDGRAKLNAYLDDYANLIDGLTRLYESTGDLQWIGAALDLARVMIDEFADAERGGFFFTGKTHESLIARTKDLFDNATPSGNGMAATALLRLSALTGRDDLREVALEALQTARRVIESAPTAGGQSLIALDLALSPVQQIVVIAGSETQELDTALEALYSGFFLPHAVIAPANAPRVDGSTQQLPLFADRPARNGRTTTYICENFTCQEPVNGVDGLIAALKKLVDQPGAHR